MRATLYYRTGVDVDRVIGVSAKIDASSCRCGTSYLGVHNEWHVVGHERQRL